MKTEHSESVFPCGIVMSFLLTLISIMGSGLLLGFFLDAGSLFFHVGGGIVLLVIILAAVVGPSLYNRIVSRFEKERNVLGKTDDFGTVQGLRGTFIRLLVYEDGIEIRAFYHRFFVPFSEIVEFSTNEEGYLSKRLNILTTKKGPPRYLISYSNQFSAMVRTIEQKVTSLQAN